MGKGIINFTKDGNFKEFNSLVKEYLTKQKTQKFVHIFDYIYPLTKLTKSTYAKNTYEITNHVNLSGYNPLKGPSFISLTNIYTSKDGITVLGLKEGTHPNNKEKKQLLKAGIKAYCYNLVPTVIFAASLGLQVKSTGIVKGT